MDHGRPCWTGAAETSWRSWCEATSRLVVCGRPRLELRTDLAADTRRPRASAPGPQRPQSRRPGRCGLAGCSPTLVGDGHHRPQATPPPTIAPLNGKTRRLGQCSSPPHRTHGGRRAIAGSESSNCPSADGRTRRSRARRARTPRCGSSLRHPTDGANRARHGGAVDSPRPRHRRRDRHNAATARRTGRRNQTAREQCARHVHPLAVLQPGGATRLVQSPTRQPSGSRHARPGP